LQSFFGEAPESALTDSAPFLEWACILIAATHEVPRTCLYTGIFGCIGFLRETGLYSVLRTIFGRMIIAGRRGMVLLLFSHPLLKKEMRRDNDGNDSEAYDGRRLPF
jgi:hypothetical protein